MFGMESNTRQKKEELFCLENRVANSSDFVDFIRHLKTQGAFLNSILYQGLNGDDFIKCQKLAKSYQVLEAVAERTRKRVMEKK